MGRLTVGADMFALLMAKLGDTRGKPRMTNIVQRAHALGCKAAYQLMLALGTWIKQG